LNSIPAPTRLVLTLPSSASIRSAFLGDRARLEDFTGTNFVLTPEPATAGLAALSLAALTLAGKLVRRRR